MRHDLLDGLVVSALSGQGLLTRERCGIDELPELCSVLKNSVNWVSLRTSIGQYLVDNEIEIAELIESESNKGCLYEVLLTDER